MQVHTYALLRAVELLVIYKKKVNRVHTAFARTTAAIYQRATLKSTSDDLASKAVAGKKMMAIELYYKASTSV